ncbi:proton-coupled folate transporter-like [Adelges cooleyi]|uniref:proton-coupled folate transporter-like n=1 Tax=Adelges cooleyi TaxID=133065 RepID=UPI002180125B|nr:proton-coupled folate transporter-like [Adelges cooleyi]
MLTYLKSKLSVEPVVFMYFLTAVFSNNLSTNLLLYKACDPSGAIGQRVGAGCDHETDAQHVVAPINGWKGLVQQVVPTVLALFAGTWSDRHGRSRRPLILLPVIGQILSDLLSVYCTVNWSMSPWLTAVFQVTAVTVTGGSAMLFNGVNSYVADTTTEEWRTVKFGMVTCVIFVGSIMGMLIYGYVVVMLGFVSAYFVSIALGTTTMAMAFVFIKNTAVPYNKEPLFQDIIHTIDPLSVLRTCCQVMTKRRTGHTSLVLWLVVVLCAPFTCVPLDGEISVMYLFLRYKFHWNEVDFSIFNAYQMVIILGGTIFSLSILSHKLGWNDALIGLISSVFDLLASLSFFLASKSWHLYLVPPLEFFRGAAFSVTSSIASRCVGPDELGAMNSIKISIESSMKGVFLPIYNMCYNTTLEVMPSGFFLISSCLTAPLIIIFGVIYFLSRNSNKSLNINSNTISKPKREQSLMKKGGVINYHI